MVVFTKTMSMLAATNVRPAAPPRGTARICRSLVSIPSSSKTSALLCLADMITTVMESAYYGRCTSTATAGGIVLVKTGTILVLATYVDPVTAADAVPYLHSQIDQLIKTWAL